MKPDKFKQANPKDQLTVIVMAIEGHVDNIRDKVSFDRALDALTVLVEDLRLLSPFLNSEWVPIDLANAG